MDSRKDPEEPCNTETDEETISPRNKWLRRESFADREITLVHISADKDNGVLGFFEGLSSR